MYHGGYGDEPSHPALVAVSVVFGAVFGLVLGAVAFLLATVFPAMLATALPSMSVAVFLALWSIAVLVPLGAFAHVMRSGRGLGTRTFAGCGMTAIVVLFAGELSGTISVYPWHTTFYIMPVHGAPSAPPVPRPRR